MTVSSLAEIATRVRSTGAVSDADVIAARTAVYRGELGVTADAARQMFAIERARVQHAAGWTQLFVEVLTDYVLNQEPPQGYVSDANADFVVSEIKRRKFPSTDGDVALVVNLIEQAREVPAAFAAFALSLVKDAAIYGDGVDAHGRPHGSGTVSEADVDMLRRILWGAGSEELLAVSRAEAEALFAIADATLDADNHPAFEELFARAVGNYLIGATGRSVPDRATALRWQTEAPYKADVVGMLTKVLQSLPAATDPGFIRDTIGKAQSLGADLETRFQRENAEREAAIAAAEILSPEKAGWLIDRVNRNGKFAPAERALMRFLAREARELDGPVQDLAAKVA